MCLPYLIFRPVYWLDTHLVFYLVLSYVNLTTKCMVTKQIFIHNVKFSFWVSIYYSKNSQSSWGICHSDCIRVKLGDNCIQNFNLGRYILGCTVGNLVLRRRASGVGNLVLRLRASGAVKRDFRTYIRRYTSTNENFEYGYSHSNALRHFDLKFEHCKLHLAARHPTKGDVIDDVKLFPTVSNFWRYPIRRRVTNTSSLESYFVVLQAIEGAIGGNSYQHNKVNQWTSNVVEQCLNQLTKLGKPFKYIGNYCMYCILSIVWHKKSQNSISP